MRVELHTDDALALLPEWSSLFARDPSATPFLAPGFADAWWRHWVAGVRPWVLAVREEAELVALAPLVLRRRGPLRTLAPLGFHVGNHWNLLAEPERRQAATEAVAGELARRRGEWDALVLDTLPAGAPLAGALDAVGLRVLRRAPRGYPAMPLPERFDDYLAGLSRDRRSNLRRHLRRLDLAELELVEVRDPARLGTTVARWQEIRGRWWRARGKDLNPDHARPGFRAFMTTLLERLVPEGRAVAWELRRGDELLGVSVNLCDESTFYWWLSGFEPEAAPLGPGKIVIGESIRRSIEAGRVAYDFMVGQEPYKYWFGGRDVEVPRLLVSSRRPRSMLARTTVTAGDRPRRPQPPAG